MTISAVSPNPAGADLQPYFQQRRAQMYDLAKALQSGDMQAAQQSYQAIVNLGQQGPFKNGTPFAMASREQDFQAIGQALQSGDLNAAKAAFRELAGTFRQPPSPGAASVGQDVVELSGGQ
ncbi:MAG TPA: hypothetical protein VFB28_05525 [Terriglobales bacterium]|nr:hypothetical protein [Terriglobales bacterium]